MSKPAEVMVAVLPRDRYQVASDLVALTKPRVLLMVLATTLVGYFVALTGPADYHRMAHLLFGTPLAASGTLALNQYVERDVDARMERTKRRPLPDGRLQPLEALLFASALTSLGTVYLASSVGFAVAILTLSTTVLYIGAYTPLKLRTASCMLVGAVPGALPPVIGWVTARGRLELGAAASARRVLVASLLYLPLLLALLAFDKP